jgi:hypothetical protein
MWGNGGQPRRQAQAMPEPNLPEVGQDAGNHMRINTLVRYTNGAHTFLAIVKSSHTDREGRVMLKRDDDGRFVWADQSKLEEV